jgi:ubiquinone/menaquinone biosynthesis C-methylase UbiE
MSQPTSFDSATSATRHLATTPIAGRSHIPPASSPYPLPNIPEEAQRLNLQHFILRTALRGNALVPLGGSMATGAQPMGGSWMQHIVGHVMQGATPVQALAPQHILDVGSGTGRWAVEMARQFPGATVVGVDIVPPVQPYDDKRTLPSNYTFVQGDVLQRLPFPDASFEYVHMRFLNLGIPRQRWQGVINELARLTAPGGWFESIEALLPAETGPAFSRFIDLFARLLAARQIDLAHSRIVESYLRQAPVRFTRIQSRLIEVPIGKYGGFVGLSMAWNILLGIHNMRAVYQQTGLLQSEDWEPLRDALDAEFDSVLYRPTMPLYCVIGQRQE